MAFDYSPLWETMKRKKISQYDLVNNGVDKRTMDQLRHNRNITVLTLSKICAILNCSPNDVVKITNDDLPDSIGQEDDTKQTGQ